MILERIKQYIDLKGISVSAFERSIGMSNASFGKSLKNGGAIGSDKLENILKTYPDISPFWLMTGVGEMLISEESSSNPEQTQGNDERYIMRLMDKIASQAEEIGKLKAELAETKKTRGKTCSTCKHRFYCACRPIGFALLPFNRRDR